MIPARIVDICQSTPTVKSFVLDLGRHAFHFLPGQWIDCYANLDGEEAVAGYSLTSMPLDTRTIQISVKLVGENPVTHHLHHDAKVGDLLQVDGGHGDFQFTPETASSVVLIAGGIGITPLISIIRTLDGTAADVEARLVYSVSTAEELLFGAELDQIAARNTHITWTPTVTQASPGWRGRTGRIDTHMLTEAGAVSGPLYFVCGPPEMTDGMVALVRSRGVPLADINYERW